MLRVTRISLYSWIANLSFAFLIIMIFFLFLKLGYIVCLIKRIEGGRAQLYLWRHGCIILSVIPPFFLERLNAFEV
jgi:hypothetical protein